MARKTQKEKFTQPCINCNGRNHIVLHEHTVSWDDEGGCLWGSTAYQTVKCEGCDEISFRIIKENSEDYIYEEEIEYLQAIERFPRPIKWSFPDWATELEVPGMFKLLKETYAALESNLFTLAAMGIRAIIDLFYLYKLGDDIGGFEQKLKQIESLKLIDSNEKALLAFLVDMGSAASHRSFSPTEKMIREAIEIMEHLLLKHYIYPQRATELNEKAGLLNDQVPKKPKKTEKRKHP